MEVVKKKKKRKKERKGQIPNMKVDLVGFTDSLDLGYKRKNNQGQHEGFESQQLEK